MQSQLKAEYHVRPATIEDIPFIFSSWLKSYRDGAAVKSVPNTIYYRDHHVIIQKILAAPSLYIRVACDLEDPAHIYAYIVGERAADMAVLHWVYCKHPFRNCGISTTLYKDFVENHSEVHYTHAGKIAGKLVQNHQVTYNPYLIWVYR